MNSYKPIPYVSGADKGFTSIAGSGAVTVDELRFLYSVLKIKDPCTGTLRHQVLNRTWQVYQAATKRQFSQRLRRVAEWPPAHLSGAVAEMGDYDQLRDGTPR